MKPRRLRALLVAALLGGAGLAVGAAGGAPADTAAALSGLRAYHHQHVLDAGIVGSSLVLVRDGRVLLHECVGSADLARKHAVDERTIYHWASITKTFTAIAIMQLRDRGRLTLDDPVVRYIPELRQVHDPYGNIEEVTIRRLLTHSAGFRNPTWPWGGDKPWHPFEPTQWAQLAAMLPYTEIEFAPGSRYSYSNPGIVFLGRIIELLSGDDYEVYVDKNILKPLEMSHSYFDATPYHLLPFRSASYFVSKEGVRRPAPFDVDTGITVSNGGLNAPLDDMAKYLAFLIGDPGRQAVYDGVLKRASLEEMFVPRIPAEREGEDSISLGLGFFVEDRGGRRLVGHSGSQNAFISHFYVCPALRAGYLVAFNTEWETAGGDASKEKTRLVDADLRRYVLKNVLPALEPRP